MNTKKEKETLRQTKKFLEFCRINKRLSPASIRGYNFDLRFFNEFLDTLNPPVQSYSQVTKEIIEAYLVTLQGYAVKTIRRKLAGIQSFFSYLEYENFLQSNPFHKFKLAMKTPYKMRTSMTIEEINSLLQKVYEDKPVKRLPACAITANSKGFLRLRNIAIMELLFAGGMRVSELCSISFSDVDMNENVILIHGKGNRERYVYLSNGEVIQALKKYLVSRKQLNIATDCVFITKNSDKLTTQSVRDLVTKYANLASIKKNITPHIFRHTFATLLLEEGVDIKYIQDFLGHSSISTTQLYLHTTNKQKRTIISTMHPREKIFLTK